MSKKNVYIIIIVICMLGTAGVLYYGFFRTPTYTPSGSPAPSGSITGPSAGNTAELTPATSGNFGQTSTGFSAPAVFPADNQFDWTLLDSPTFKSLSAVPDLEQDPQIGRNNPFIATK